MSPLKVYEAKIDIRTYVNICYMHYCKSIYVSMYTLYVRMYAYNHLGCNYELKIIVHIYTSKWLCEK